MTAMRARSLIPNSATIPLAVCLVIAITSMFWFGYRATREWQHSTTEAAEARARNQLTVLTAALDRDMKGAQTRVLLPFNRAILNTSLPYDLADRFAGGFARYPYVESFFVWTIAADGNETTYVFNRADRPPAWDVRRESEDWYPVLIRHAPAAIDSVVAAARAQAPTGARFVTFEHRFGDTPYQVVAQLLYSGDVGVRLYATVGFTVNLQWTRTRYFADFIRDMRDIIEDPELYIEIVDDVGERVSASGKAIDNNLMSRAFPVLFADPVVTGTRPAEHVPEWSVRVGAGDDAALAAASRGASRTLALLAVAGIITIVALALTLRAARAAAELATLQSEFVSAVSHEMKTPLSLITLASDTLAAGRYDSASIIKDYGELLAKEAHQLTRLIDNVLCYARLHDSATKTSVEPIDLLELVEESVNRFRLQLNTLSFNVQLQLPLDIPPIHGDRIMLQHAVDNLIDNAVKHGESGRQLTVKVFTEADRVHIQVGDAGQGIPSNETHRVFDKFYRGAGAKQRGSGLGLAIVKQIVQEHRGRIAIHTEAGKGTTVDISLPIAHVDSAGTAA
jgi:signal transduction histidine kinase